MTAFDRLDPLLQHHIVNSLGWRTLRPLQQEAVDPILEGEDALLLAPTAGGKTEAAIFPILSKMIDEDWPRLSVVYVCPIKALLNNLLERLETYTGFAGRRAAIWHGDVGPTARKRMLKDPPNVLLTTPESLEVMLISPKSKRSAFLQDLRVLIVDEIHAFAGDDRGWHLMAVLERLTRMTGRPIQRLGLSATVGNPEDLAAWMAGPDRRPAKVIAPAAEGVEVPAEVTIDFVGNLKNAGTVIHRLHRGEKRLVFCDSRAGVEELATELRRLGTQVFVSHSSLSLSERRRAEEAFASAEDCVIVATSTLELGLDVGDLDRVIQIGCPSTVASFLQRLGRTGRRSGTTRNCLFLAPNDESLLFTCGLVRLWGAGQVEPVVPPLIPYHVLAQQLLALTLQQEAPGRELWKEWLGGFCRAASLEEGTVHQSIEEMLEKGYLAQDTGLLFLGPESEKRFGARNYMDLCSVFAAEPLFQVLHGREEIGKVHPISFTQREGQKAVLSLGGRAWLVEEIDWKRQRAHAKPLEATGKSRWLGSGRAAGYLHCQEVLQTLKGENVPCKLTQRAQERLAGLREEFGWVHDPEPLVAAEPNGEMSWYTFAGLRANRLLHALLPLSANPERGPNNLTVPLLPDASRDSLLNELTELEPGELKPEAIPVDDEALEGLKFSEVLPRELALRELRVRDFDEIAIRSWGEQFVGRFPKQRQRPNLRLIVNQGDPAP